MKELEYPFDNGFIMKKKRSLKRQLLGDGAVRLKKRVAVLGGSTTEDIIPGYYMNKVHWNSVKADGNVPDALLREMLEKSYRLVLGGFSKKKQRALLEGEKKDVI